MPTINLCVETVSPIINFSGTCEKFFVIKNNFLYFLDNKKTDKLLSFLCLLGDFNEFCISSDNRNATEWFRERKFLTKELLEEICFKKIPCNTKEHVRRVFSFNEKTENSPFFLNNFLKNQITNLLLFEYIRCNYEKINDYVGKLLIFFEKNNIFRDKTCSFQFFMNCLFETEKVKFFSEIASDNHFEAVFVNKKTEPGLFYIEKIFNSNDTMFFECLTQGRLLFFNIRYDKDYLFFQNAEKYLQLAEYITTLRKKEEKKILSAKVLSTDYQKEKTSFSDFSFANAGVINKNQLFYLCLSEENKENLNRLLSANASVFLFYYQKKENCSYGLLNYLKVHF